MDTYDMIKWRETYFGLDRKGAAQAMGIALNSLKAYETGKPIPAYIPLVCAAIANNIGPWQLPPHMLKEKQKNPDIKPSSLPRGNPNWMNKEAS